MLGLLRYGLIILTVMLSVMASPYAQQDGEVISEIRVEGTQRIAPATVRSYMPVAEGQEITLEKLNQIISTLFATNLFNDVTIRVEEGAMIVTVDENPIINRVAIEGNDVLKDDVLLQILNIRPRRIFTREVALNGKALLMEVYRQSGRYAAVIEPKIIELPDKRIDLVFEVDEGPLIKISKVKFIGNQAFSDRALRNVIVSREAKWYVFLSANDKYDPDRLRLDEQRVNQFYLQNGFADIDVIRATGELLPDHSGFVLTFLLEEGQQYKVSSVTVNSDIASVAVESLLEVNTVEIDEVYDVRYLEETLSNMTDKLGEFGFAFVDIEPDFDLDEENATMAITIKINKSAQNYVEEIAIRGNDRTLDRVIRREMELVEGDSFNQLKLTRSVRNIRNLGYFSNVEVDVLPGSDSQQSVVDILVAEQSTGSFKVGVGYSTLDEAKATLGIEENNFLGTGRSVSANLSVSGLDTNFRAGIVEPYLFNRNLTGSAAVFVDEEEFSDITLREQGIDLGVGFGAENNFRHRIGYRLAQTQTTSSSTTATSISGDEEAQLISEVDYRITQDHRDSRINPRDGYLWSASAGLAGLGGDAQYLRTTLNGQYLKPFLFRRVVFGVEGEIGFIHGLSQKVSRSERFVIGGRKVRGFDSTGIGPRDTGDSSAVGGNRYYVASVNMITDYGLDPDLGLQWTLFADAGSLWDTDYPVGVTGADDNTLRASIGYGLLWDTAIGPLTFFWSIPVSHEDYDRTESFQFSFGGRF